MLDVAIIGGGVTGCSLLYALARYRLRVALLEAGNDVGVATTKANSAIVHAGYDPEPGTLMARYNAEGNRLITKMAAELDILYKNTGSLVLAFTEAERATLEELRRRGLANGVPGMELWGAEELRRREPNVSEAALAALYAPTAGVVNPWELAFAQAEVAVQNGARVMLDSLVEAIDRREGRFTLHGPAGPVEARFVVNCAGVHAAEVAALVGDASFSITRNRGQYYLLDKAQGEAVRHVVFQCPGPEGKGVLVAPTVHGNLIVGPNAEPSESRATTAEGLEFVRHAAVKSVPGVDFRQSIRNFAGLRAQASTGDFVVGESPAVPGFFHLAGIKSPGLTAAPAMALAMVRLLGQAGLPLAEKESFINSRKILRFNHLSRAEKAEAVARNPLYGRIVCRCETVTEGEILDALRRPLPPRSLDAVKRRCGPGMGRCQGGFCGPRVQALIARELGLPQGEIPQDRTGMNIVLGRTKDKGFIEDTAAANAAVNTAEGGARHG